VSFPRASKKGHPLADSSFRNRQPTFRLVTMLLEARQMTVFM